MVLYSEAGREMNYFEQKFEYNKEITVTHQCKRRIDKVSAILFRNEDQESYARREILEEEISQGWVGLSSEVKEICRETGTAGRHQGVCFKEGRHHY